MSVTPGLVWQTIRAVSGSEAFATPWNNTSFVIGAPGPITIEQQYTMQVEVLTIGNPATDVIQFTASCPAGGDVFTVASGFSDLDVGMAVVTATPDIMPAGLQIIAVDMPSGSQIALGGGYGPFAYAENPWKWHMPPGVALTTATPLSAIDSYPIGTLGVTVAPSSGVTVTDINMDGDDMAPDATVGDGSAMSNSGGQAMGLFTVQFPSAGTYQVTVAYTPVNDALIQPDDPVYSATQSTLTVEVT